MWYMWNDIFIHQKWDMYIIHDPLVNKMQVLINIFYCDFNFNLTTKARKKFLKIVWNKAIVSHESKGMKQIPKQRHIKYIHKQKESVWNKRKTLPIF